MEIITVLILRLLAKNAYKLIKNAMIIDKKGTL